MAAKNVPVSRGVLLGKEPSCGCARPGTLTQEQVAEDAGVSWRYLQELEAGKGTNPSLTVLCGLKMALGCSWDELLIGMP